MIVRKPEAPERLLYIQNAGQTELRCNVSIVNNPVPPSGVGFINGSAGPTINLTTANGRCTHPGADGVVSKCVAVAIPATQTIPIPLKINTAGVASGRYFREVVIRSNAAANPTLTVGLAIGVQSFAVAAETTVVGKGASNATVGEK